MRLFLPLLLLLFITSTNADEKLQYEVEVQVVDLQISVSDGHGNYITNLSPEDFIVTEDRVPQEILDLDTNREPFSIGIVLDTSGSMERLWTLTKRCTEQFISAMRPEDEFFVMQFDDEVRLNQDFTQAGDRSYKLRGLHYGDQTRLYDGMLNAIEKLRDAHYARRALFVISDGENTLGKAGEKDVEELAQKTKTIIYSLIMGEGAEGAINVLQAFSMSTGGTYFVMHDDYPFMKAAYDKIASDLAHRFTLYYHSRSNYNLERKPHILVKMKNKDWQVQFQRTFYPSVQQ